MADVLFTVRNAFALGAYNTAIAEASDIENLDDHGHIEKDYYVYRSYIEMGEYNMVISEVSDAAPTALQAVKMLALYLSGRQSAEEVLTTLTTWLEDPVCSGNTTLQLIAAIVYAHEENYIEALRCCHSGATLEMLALAVHVLLAMNRPDQAEKQVKAMSAIDDDATITQLATAWVALALGGAKVQEALYIYQELAEKFSRTVRLHNGMAVCLMKMGNFEDAEKELLEAYDKNPKDADTLANLYIVGLHLSKNVARYLTQLKTSAAKHPFVRRLEMAEKAYDVAAAAGF